MLQRLDLGLTALQPDCSQGRLRLTKGTGAPILGQDANELIYSKKYKYSGHKFGSWQTTEAVKLLEN